MVDGESRETRRELNKLPYLRPMDLVYLDTGRLTTLMFELNVFGHIRRTAREVATATTYKSQIVAP